MENTIELEILGLSSSQSQTGSFALILGEVSGNRRLPIIIGMFEAQAIAIEIEEIAPNRPMTHDLFKTFAIGFDITFTHINIARLKEGVFYAELHAQKGEENLVLDARPSDAIALALRFDVPIYTNEKIMDEAGIVIEDDFGDEIEEDDELIEHVEDLVSDSNEDITIEELQVMLNEALTNEDYEEAARLRDEINKKANS